MRHKRLQHAKRILWEDGAPYRDRVDWIGLDKDGRLVVYNHRQNPNRTIFPKWTLDQAGTLRIPIEGAIIPTRD